jgi:glycosyl transferase, family 25
MNQGEPPVNSIADSLMASFERVYIINLPERTDRRKRVESELRRIGLNINGRGEFFNAIRPADAGPFPNIGARGCFLSHLAILQEARKAGLQSILVLEDDLVFVRDFTSLVNPVVDALNKTEWDIIYFGYVGFSSQGTGPIERCDEPLGQTHFYGIREPGLSQLCDYLLSVIERPAGHPDGGPMYPDAAFNMFRQRNPSVSTYIAVPELGIQGSSPSDIAGFHWFDKVPVLRWIASIARRVKLWLTR